MITPRFSGPASIKQLVITLDGEVVPAVNERLGIYVGPATLAPGAHALEVVATAAAGRTATTQVTIHAAGGLGVACESRADCSTPFCGFDGEQSLCTEPCGPARECPDGFTCRNATDGVCWPAPGRRPRRRQLPS